MNVGARRQTAANLAIVPVSPSGIGVSSFGGADVVVDLAGWFVGSPVAPTTGDCAHERAAAGVHPRHESGIADRVLRVRRPDHRRRLPTGLSAPRRSDTLDVPGRARCDRVPAPTFVHNAGLIQTGNCFALLQSGNFASPGNYVLAHRDQHACGTGIWALGGDMGTDGRFHLIVAEMRRTRSGVPVVDRTGRDVERLHRPRRHVDRRVRPGERQLRRAVRVLGHVRRVLHLSVLALLPAVRVGPVPDSSTRRCTRTTSTARRTSTSRACRVAVSTSPLEYWNGSAWVADAAAAVPVIPRENRLVNPTQVTFDGRQFVAVTKEGDWWGDTIYLDVAPSAQGPWRTYSTIAVPDRVLHLQHLLRIDRAVADGRRIARPGAVAQHVRGHPDRAVLAALLHRPAAVRSRPAPGRMVAPWPSSPSPSCCRSDRTTTPYRLVSTDGVSTFDTSEGTFLKVEPSALTRLTAEAMHDIAHYLRPAHLRPTARRSSTTRRRATTTGSSPSTC